MDSAAALLFGKTRQAVLVQLYENPDASFYLRELSRITAIGPGPLQNELNQLVKADLVLRASDGNRVTYQANARHPIFSELQSIVAKTCGLPSRLRDSLTPLADRIDYAVIYGSLAKGTNHAGSDVDLLIVGQPSLPEIIDLIQPLEEQSGREISVRLYARDEFNERRQKADPFLEAVLSGPLIPLVGAMPGTRHDA